VLAVGDVVEVVDVDIDATDEAASSIDPTERSWTPLQVTVTIIPHDRGARRVRRTLTLTVRDGLISRIVQAVAPTGIEVLHVDDCPHHDELLPRLRRLPADHDIDADLVVTLVASDDDAHRLRFLGSPTVRVNGRDVDPAAVDRTGFGLQCRLVPPTARCRVRPPTP